LKKKNSNTKSWGSASSVVAHSKQVRERHIEQERLLRQALSPVWGNGWIAKKAVPPPPTVLLALSPTVTVGWSPEETCELTLLKHDKVSGAALSPPDATAGSTREVVMGLDFGTSSTKVVLADRSLNAVYAVLFSDSIGVSSYLLPSALVETNDGHYVLTGNGMRYSDLKLAMLSSQGDSVMCSRVCAFLALTIRSARGWMYEAKREQYLRSDILWTLAIGLPTDQTAYEKHRLHFEQLAKVAWSLAGSDGHVRVGDALEAWRQREHLDLDDELEVRGMPELSAQIHGFVSSSHFDARQPNIYLLVDVGAGTLDASLFHVRKDSAGTVSFRFFTHTVEPLGAANLNRHRLTWWQSKLEEAAELEKGIRREHSANVVSVLNELELLKLPTDFRGSYPNTYDQYVKGVEVRYDGGAQSPDDDFILRIRNQVVGKVLYGAWKQQLLSQAQVKNMPFFLCGGGARHPLYESLKSRLQKTPSCSWLSAKPRDLALPSNISAPGVAHGDYDRLSVAYGLSQLIPGSFERVAALKPIVSALENTDRANLFVDKSVC
jgi:hypothetical protein